MGVVAAERIKLTSTRSPWWCSGIMVVLSLGVAALVAWAANQSNTHGDSNSKVLSLTPADATAGVSGFSVMVLMIMATLAVTSEYRFGTIRTTFQAMPNRTIVLSAKAGLLAVLGAVMIAVLSFGAYGIAKAIASGDSATSLHLETADDWRMIYGLPIYAVLGVIFAVAIGALVRQSAAAISLVVLWPLLLEPLVALFGSIGKDIRGFLPFANAQYFLDGSSSSANFHWGPWVALVYFAACVALIFAGALTLVNRRDA